MGGDVNGAVAGDAVRLADAAGMELALVLDPDAAVLSVAFQAANLRCEWIVLGADVVRGEQPGRAVQQVRAVRIAVQDAVRAEDEGDAVVRLDGSQIQVSGDLDDVGIHLAKGTEDAVGPHRGVDIEIVSGVTDVAAVGIEPNALGDDVGLNVVPEVPNRGGRGQIDVAAGGMNQVHVQVAEGLAQVDVADRGGDHSATRVQVNIEVVAGSADVRGRVQVQVLGADVQKVAIDRVEDRAGVGMDIDPVHRVDGVNPQAARDLPDEDRVAGAGRELGVVLEVQGDEVVLGADAFGAGFEDEVPRSHVGPTVRGRVDDGVAGLDARVAAGGHVVELQLALRAEIDEIGGLHVDEDAGLDVHVFPEVDADLFAGQVDDIRAVQRVGSGRRELDDELVHADGVVGPAVFHAAHVAELPDAREGDRIAGRQVVEDAHDDLVVVRVDDGRVVTFGRGELDLLLVRQAGSAAGQVNDFDAVVRADAVVRTFDDEGHVPADDVRAFDGGLRVRSLLEPSRAQRVAQLVLGPDRALLHGVDLREYRRGRRGRGREVDGNGLILQRILFTGGQLERVRVAQDHEVGLAVRQTAHFRAVGVIDDALAVVEDVAARKRDGVGRAVHVVLRIKLRLVDHGRVVVGPVFEVRVANDAVGLVEVVVLVGALVFQGVDVVVAPAQLSVLHQLPLGHLNASALFVIEHLVRVDGDRETVRRDGVDGVVTVVTGRAVDSEDHPRREAIGEPTPRVAGDGVRIVAIVREGQRRSAGHLGGEGHVEIGVVHGRVRLLIANVPVALVFPFPHGGVGLDLGLVGLLRGIAGEVQGVPEVPQLFDGSSIGFLVRPNVDQRAVGDPDPHVSALGLHGVELEVVLHGQDEDVSLGRGFEVVAHFGVPNLHPERVRGGEPDGAGQCDELDALALNEGAAVLPDQSRLRFGVDVAIRRDDLVDLQLAVLLGHVDTAAAGGRIQAAVFEVDLDRTDFFAHAIVRVDGDILGVDTGAIGVNHDGAAHVQVHVTGSVLDGAAEEQVVRRLDGDLALLVPDELDIDKVVGHHAVGMDVLDALMCDDAVVVGPAESEEPAALGPGVFEDHPLAGGGDLSVGIGVLFLENLTGPKHFDVAPVEQGIGVHVPDLPLVYVVRVLGQPVGPEPGGVLVGGVADDGLALSGHPDVDLVLDRLVGGEPGVGVRLDHLELVVRAGVGVDDNVVPFALVDSDERLVHGLAAHGLLDASGRIREAQLTRHPLAGVQCPDEQVAVGVVVDSDAAVTVQDLDFAVTGADDVAKELHVPALDADGGQLETIVVRVVLYGEVGVAQNGVHPVRVPVQGRVQAARQVERLVRAAALHEAVDVQIAGTDVDLVPRDDGAGGEHGEGVFVIRLGCVVPIGGFRNAGHVAPLAGRVAAEVEEGVRVALDEVATGLDLDGLGVDTGRRLSARFGLDQDAAGEIHDADRAAQVLDIADDLDVRGQAVVRHVGVLDLDERLRRVRARLDDAEGRRRVTVVPFVDLRVGGHRGTVEEHSAACRVRDGQLIQAEIEGAAVVDDDFRVARRVQLAGAVEALGLDDDVARLRPDGVYGHEVGGDIRLDRDRVAVLLVIVPKVDQLLLEPPNLCGECVFRIRAGVLGFQVPQPLELGLDILVQGFPILGKGDAFALLLHGQGHIVIAVNAAADGQVLLVLDADPDRAIDVNAVELVDR